MGGLGSFIPPGVRRAGRHDRRVSCDEMAHLPRAHQADMAFMDHEPFFLMKMDMGSRYLGSRLQVEIELQQRPLCFTGCLPPDKPLLCDGILYRLTHSRHAIPPTVTCSCALAPR